MRALVLAPQPFFSPRGTPFSVYYRTMVAAELGVQIDLLTYGEGENVVIPGVRLIRIPRLPFTHNVPIGPSGKKLVLDFVMLIWTVGLLLRNRYDFVHAHEESVFFVGMLKPLFRFKLVYDMHSSLPEQLLNFSFTKSRLITRLFEWLETSALRAATVVVTICPDLDAYVESRLQDRSRHLLIENSIFEDVAVGSPPGNDPSAAEVPSLPGRPLVVYTGTFEAYQGIDLLITAFRRVRERQPEASLVLVGGNPSQVSRYAALAESQGLNGTCLFTGRVSQPVAKHLARRATVLTSPRISGSNTPLKVYEQLASGIPLVATRIRSHTQVLDDEVCFLVEPTVEGIAEGICEALGDPARRDAVTRQARRRYDARYARPVYEEKMRSLLHMLR